MDVRTLAALFLAGCLATAAGAQPRAAPKAREIAFVDPFRIAIPSPAGVVRVGKRAVLVHVLVSSKVMSRSEQVLVACDGSWASSPRLTMPVGSGERSFEQLEEWAIKNTFQPVHPIRFDASGFTSLFAGPLKLSAREICASARPEPRNLQIIVAQDPPEGGSVGQAHALVTGTAERKQGRLRIWIRSTELQAELMTWPDGRIAESDGKPVQRLVPTGNYTMAQWTIDCGRLAHRKDIRHEYSAYSGAPLQTSTADGELEVAGEGSREQVIATSACRLF